MLKSSGASWERAHALNYSHTGEPINHNVDNEGIKCKESRAYAPPPASDAMESLEERIVREGRFERITTQLNPEERAFLIYRQELLERVESSVYVTEGQRQDYLNDGYTFIPDSAEMVERDGLPPVEMVRVARWELTQTRQLRYEELAEKWGVSLNRVREIGRSAHRKMEAATRR